MRTAPTKSKLPALLFCLAYAVTGCGSLPTTGEQTDTGSLRKARLAEENRQYLAAGQEYLKIAEHASILMRQEYQIDAAAAFLRGNYLDEAKRALGELKSDTLDNTQYSRRQILLARIALTEHDAPRALASLKTALRPDTPPEPRAEILQLSADAYLQTGNFLEAARQRAALDALLANNEEKDNNQQIIWQSLLKVPDVVLNQMRTAPPPDTFSGWMELAYIAKAGAAQNEPLQQSVNRWRERYPNHPASTGLISSILSREEEKAERPDSIALLLPLSGPLTKPATAIRDGFLAAHFERSDKEYRPTIRVYDTGATADSALTAYKQALNEGTTFVVGPLDKDAVNVIMRSHDSRVPTLTLNYTEQGGVENNFYQFGLSPEDEARQAADRAWMDGHNQALAIIPEGEWGLRLYNAFKARWEQLGGRLLEYQTYSPDNADFTVPLRKLLNVDESEARWQKLKALTGADIKFEPRRRADANFVFMAAFPKQARLIRPQLNFFYASDLPVYTTSHVYTGKQDSAADQDMDGVIFCDIPWLLNNKQQQALAQKIRRAWPESAEQMQRLYALGVDAYQLVPRVERLKKYSYETYTGATGVLSLDAANRIYRQLLWARFADGKPRVLDQGIAVQ